MSFEKLIFLPSISAAATSVGEVAGGNTSQTARRASAMRKPVIRMRTAATGRMSEAFAIKRNPAIEHTIPDAVLSVGTEPDRTSIYRIERFRREAIVRVENVVRPEPVHARTTEKVVHTRGVERNLDAARDVDQG